MDDKTSLEEKSFSQFNKEEIVDNSELSDSLNNDIEKSQSSNDYEPPNGGLAAWLVVFGAFCGNVAEFGVNYTWGVFLNHYNEVVYPGKMNELSWIGSICISFFFLIGPVNEWFTAKLGYTKMLIIGNILCPLALMLASISYEIWHLYLTQGVMFGIGASFIFFPCLAAMQQWFSTKRGLAVGLCMSGSGIGGLIFSNICQAAISNLDYRWALRIAGFVCFAFMLIATVLVKPPPNATVVKQESFTALYKKQKDLVINNRQFQIMLVFGTVTTFGYLTPAFYLASYAQSLGLDPWIGANLGAIMSAVNAVSMLSTGWIGDRLGRVNGLFICTFLSGIFTLAIWTTAKTEAAIWVYVVLYGFFGGGYLTLSGASLPEIAGYDNISAANGLFYVTSTLGYMFGSPIASAIISQSGYIYAAVYCGMLMTAGGLLCLMIRVVRAGWNPLIKV